MRRDPHRFRTGLFALVGILLLLAAIVAVGMGRWWLREGRTIYCYFTESVSGISVGSPLKLQGVEVGQVSEVVLLPPRRIAKRPSAVSDVDVLPGQRRSERWDSVIEVRCTVYPDALGAEAGLVMTQEELTQWVREQVNRGLRVTVKLKDITGSKYLSLGHYRLRDHPIPDLQVTRAPYVPTAVERSLSDIQRDLGTAISSLAEVNYREIAERLLDAVELIAQRVEALDTQSLQGHAEAALVAVRNRAEDPALANAIARLDTISASMVNITGRVEEIVSGEDLTETLAAFRRSAESLDRTLAGLETDVPALVARVDEVVGAAQEAIVASDVPGTTQTVRVAADSIGGAADQVGAAMRDVTAMREELRRVLREVSAMSRSVGRLARSLDEQPGAILAGRQLPEEGR